MEIETQWKVFLQNTILCYICQQLTISWLQKEIPMKRSLQLPGTLHFMIVEIICALFCASSGTEMLKVIFEKCWLTPVNQAISIEKPTIILFWYHAKSTRKMMTSKSFCSDSLWNIILKCEKLLTTERSRGVFLSEICNTVIRLKFDLFLVHKLAKWFHFFFSPEELINELEEAQCTETSFMGWLCASISFLYSTLSVFICLYTIILLHCLRTRHDCFKRVTGISWLFRVFLKREKTK